MNSSELLIVRKLYTTGEQESVPVLKSVCSTHLIKSLYATAETSKLLDKDHLSVKVSLKMVISSVR